MTSVTVTLTYKEIEFDVQATAGVDVVEKRMGHSDEQPGVFIEGLEYSSPLTGKPVSKRLENFINKTFWDEVTDHLLDEYAQG